jgi:hypothetical protein
MEDLEKKKLHLRILIKYVQLNCYKINSLTADAIRVKDKLVEIEIANDDTELKVKEAIEREFLF